MQQTAKVVSRSAFVLSGKRFTSWDEWARATRPTVENHTQWNDTRNKVVLALHSDGPFKVNEVLSFGSTAKGTAVRDRLEVDLVVIVSNFKQEWLAEYKRLLKEWALTHLGVDAQELEFCVRFKFNGVSVDLTPSEWPQCSASHQVEFVKRQNALCKDVIRMAKDWRDMQDWGRKNKFFTKPKSFLIELMVRQEFW